MKNTILLLPTPAHLSSILELNFTVDRSFNTLRMKTSASGLQSANMILQVAALLL